MLTQQGFEQYARGVLYDRVLPLLQHKGQQYSAGSAFGNFERVAKIFHMGDSQILMIYASKHWDALCGNPLSRETPERAIDIIIYMLLLMAMEECDESISCGAD